VVRVNEQSKKKPIGDVFRNSGHNWNIDWLVWVLVAQMTGVWLCKNGHKWGYVLLHWAGICPECGERLLFFNVVRGNRAGVNFRPRDTQDEPEQ